VIITKAPLRISFIGGGSDFESFYNHNESIGGIVLGCTINRYVYVCLNKLSELADEFIRFTYRTTESVNAIQELRHPVTREMLQNLHWKVPINIATFADLPGRSGMGSSSAFSVALAAALLTFQGKTVTSKETSSLAILVERKILKEYGGVQDQIQASYGGFRTYRFRKNQIEASDSLLDKPTVVSIFESLYLVPVSKDRHSSSISKATDSFLKSVPAIKQTNQLVEVAEELVDVLVTTKSLENKIATIANCVNISHEFKLKSNNEYISTVISELITLGKKNGALGSKLCGAGAGGFLLFVVPKSEKARFEGTFLQRGAFQVEPDFDGNQVQNF
jgi:D-glycero-alpha-D-manno-heptose-7-phosphate kinase